MSAMLTTGYSKIKGLMLLSVSLMLTACASGTTRIEESWKFNEETIQAVKTKCSSTFGDASGGKFSELWANKRAILAQARGCSIAANTLAEQAEARNRVIGNGQN